MQCEPLCLSCEHYKSGDVCEVKKEIMIEIKTGEKDCPEYKEEQHERIYKDIAPGL